ncbi:MAG: hypothetical protein WC750_00285 [Patescibacteria group bacterium]|jgi:hypothetical protein
MLNQTQAKQKFRATLAMLLVSVLWPFIGALLSILLTAIGVKNMAIGVLLFFIVWLALFIWLFIQCWRLASEVGVTPWAALWLLFPFIGIFLIGMLFLEPLKYMADGKPEDKKLPRTWDLIKQTWKLYTETFKDSVKVSLYFLYASIVCGIIAAIGVYLGVSYQLMALCLTLPLALANLWISILVFHRVAALEAGQDSYQPLTASWRKWLSYVWIAVEIVVFAVGPLILAALIVLLVSFLTGNWQSIASLALPTLTNINAGSRLGLTILSIVLFVPAWIWLIYKTAVWNSFAMPNLVLDDKKGLVNLKEATRIAKGRWWGLFWKNQLSGIVFGGYSMLIGIGMSIAILILATVFKTLNLGLSVDALLTQVSDGVIAMIIVPLFMGYSVKLYRAFKKTAG